MDGGQKFKDWLTTNEKTTRDAGTALGLFPNHVSSICSGKIRPSLVNAFKIERYTEGAVKAIDFIDEADLQLYANRDNENENTSICDYGNINSRRVIG